MDWNDELLDRLAVQIPCGYHPTGIASSEPTALAAMALLANSRPATAALAWLATCQAADGSVAPTANRQSADAAAAAVGWPTGWAVLAALTEKRRQIGNGGNGPKFDVSRALNWILQTAGDSAAGSQEATSATGVVGWPWVTGTYSWVEPTAIHVVALKAAGYAEHPRTREAIAMLRDRLLQSGGCNYGNTVVLGQELRPHVQPTGLAMLALADETDDPKRRIARSLDYLAKSLSIETTSASLAYGLIGLAAHGRFPADARKWLEAAYLRTVARDAAGYKLALLSLAAAGNECPLVALSAKRARTPIPKQPAISNPSS